MRKHVCLVMILASICVMSGCAQNKTRVAEGAGIGGVLGAATGAIIGYQSGHPVEGALIGGAAGGATGAVLGAQVEKESDETPSQ